MLLYVYISDGKIYETPETLRTVSAEGLTFRGENQERNYEPHNWCICLHLVHIARDENPPSLGLRPTFILSVNVYFKSSLSVQDS